MMVVCLYGSGDVRVLKGNVNAILGSVGFGIRKGSSDGIVVFEVFMRKREREMVLVMLALLEGGADQVPGGSMVVAAVITIFFFSGSNSGTDGSDVLVVTSVCIYVYLLYAYIYISI